MKSIFPEKQVVNSEADLLKMYFENLQSSINALLEVTGKGETAF